MMIDTPKPSFHIREIPVYGDAILAPMDGYSDWPFRSLCRELGSAMSYTEFVKVEKILSRSKQPRAPHRHSGPSGRMERWPISPA